MGPTEDPEAPNRPEMLIECRYCGNLIEQTRAAMEFHRNRCAKWPTEQPKQTMEQPVARATKF